jgi:hypothetical protein
MIVRLFHPRLDTWDDHFVLEVSGVIEPLTPVGQATVQALQLNDLSEVQDRHFLLAQGEW